MSMNRQQQEAGYIRKQLLLSPQQAEFLHEEAGRANTSESDVVRQWIDQRMKAQQEKALAALEGIFGMWGDYTAEDEAVLAAGRQSLTRIGEHHESQRLDGTIPNQKRRPD